MARRIKTLAHIIQAMGYTVVLEKSYCNTDRKPRGYRYITHVGKGKHGTRLIVRDSMGEIVLVHDTAQTYRCNKEVEDWIADRKKEEVNG